MRPDRNQECEDGDKGAAEKELRRAERLPLRLLHYILPAEPNDCEALCSNAGAKRCAKTIGFSGEPGRASASSGSTARPDPGVAGNLPAIRVAGAEGEGLDWRTD